MWSAWCKIRFGITSSAVANANPLGSHPRLPARNSGAASPPLKPRHRQTFHHPGFLPWRLSDWARSLFICIYVQGWHPAVQPAPGYVGRRSPCLAPGQPPERLRVPRILAALLLILALVGTIGGLGTAISGPARTWAAKLPEGIPRLQERLSFMRAPIDTVQRFWQQVENFGGTAPAPATAPAAATTFLTKLFTGTRNFASGFLTTLLFLFFLLQAGDIFLHRLVEVLPRFGSKRQVIEISHQIESDISAYLVTITIMNAAVGSAMALAMWRTGMGDPIFWGTVAFLLNYVPVLGTALGVVIFLLAGLLTADPLW
jgi:AI-2E family transporter